MDGHTRSGAALVAGGSPRPVNREVTRRGFVTVIGGVLLTSAWPVRASVPSDALTTISPFGRSGPRSLRARPVRPPVGEAGTPASAATGLESLRRITACSHDLFRAVTGSLASKPNVDRRWLLLATRARDAFGEASAAVCLPALGYPATGLLGGSAARDLRLTRPAVRRAGRWLTLRRGAAGVARCCLRSRPAVERVRRGAALLRHGASSGEAG